jgi:DNA-binding MarR family transcriptional regulator
MGGGFMDVFSQKLNDILVDTFRSILKVEEQALKSTGKMDLSISEMHLIEAVGKNKETGRTISDIAQDLKITLSSVTIAINKLQKKGYVEKVKSAEDARMVFVNLTRMGQKMDSAHKFFHENMVRSVAKELSEDEKNAMLKGIVKLNDFFKKKLPSTEG